MAALAEQHGEEAIAILKQVVLSASDKKLPIAETVRQYIQASVAMHAADPQLHRILIDRIPYFTGKSPLMRKFFEEAFAVVQLWLSSQKHLIRPGEVDAMSYMLVTTVESVSHLDLLDRPKSLTHDAFVEELTQLVLGYLGLGSDRLRPVAAKHRA